MIVNEYIDTNSCVITFVMRDKDDWFNNYIDDIVDSDVEYNMTDVDEYIDCKESENKLYDKINDFVESNYPEISIDNVQFEYPECEITIWITGNTDIINNKDFITDIENIINSDYYEINIEGDIVTYYNDDVQDVDISGKSYWEDFEFKGISNFNE